MHSVAVATVVLLIVGLAHVTFQKHVTLVVNGRPQAVSTTSASVHDLLMGEGISLTSAVLVTPPPATNLADGMTVVVSAAPAGSLAAVFTPVIPGSTGVGVWVVDGSSQELVGSSDSASSSGTSPVVSVRAVVSGKVHDVSTNAGTAGALLKAMGISPDANDRVQPPLSTPLHVRDDDLGRARGHPDPAPGHRHPVSHDHDVLAEDDAGHAQGPRRTGSPATDVPPISCGWSTA